MTEAWSYELRKAIVGYNQRIRVYRANHGKRSVEDDGFLVENIRTPHECRWCGQDLIVHRKAILCPGCDRR